MNLFGKRQIEKSEDLSGKRKELNYPGDISGNAEIIIPANEENRPDLLGSLEEKAVAILINNYGIEIYFVDLDGNLRFLRMERDELKGWMGDSDDLKAAVKTIENKLSAEHFTILKGPETAIPKKAHMQYLKKTEVKE